MIAHTHKTNKDLSAYSVVSVRRALVVAVLCVWGCDKPPTAETEPNRPQSRSLMRDAEVKRPVVPADALISAGAHSLNVDTFATAVAEARVLRHWKSGKPADIEALNSQPFRKKLLIRALETRIVRHEVRARGVQLDPQDHDRLLDQAMLGLPPQGRATASQRAALPRDPDEIDARLVARFGLPATHIRNAIRDLAEHSAFAHTLLELVPPETIKGTWTDKQTCISLELFRIARVPTSQEISAAVKSRQKDMPEYYAAHPRLFQRRARVFLRRFMLEIKEESGAATSAEVRAAVEAARRKVESGADLEKLVRAEGALRDRRSGGRISRVREKAPELFERPRGYLSPVAREGSAWAFYRVEGTAPKLDRPLSDPRVQREIAAALLRRDDQLPHARGLGLELSRRLRAGEASALLAPWLKSQRIRTAKTKRFCKSIGDRVPTIGLAPKLAEAVFQLSEQQPISRRVRVRQDYVVARLLERTTPTDAEWAEAQADFTVRWKAERGPKIVKEWLNDYLKNSTLTLDIERLRALPLQALIKPTL